MYRFRLPGRFLVHGRPRLLTHTLRHIPAAGRSIIATGVLALAITAASLTLEWLPASSLPPAAHAQQTPQLGFHIPAGDAEHMQAAHRAGAEFVVLVVSWQDIEPEPDYLYWDRMDAAMRAAAYYGLGIVARLDRPPDWAEADSGPAPWQLDAYARFVQRVTQRYGERLDGVILWNEPNLASEWHGQPPDPAGYTALLGAGYEAAKAAQPGLTVLMAGLAFTNGDGDRAMNDLAFLRGVYEAGGGAYFDAMAAHAYGFGAPPQQAPAPDRLNFRRIELYRERMAAAGDQAKPVWITEMGWRTAAPDSADAWQVVTPAQQMDYSLAALAYVRSHYSWIPRVAFWELNAREDGYGYALWEGAGATTPTYDALRAQARRRCGGEPCAAAGEVIAATGGGVAILAADSIVRLGDVGTLHPHWVHLARGDGFSPTWTTEFFLTPERLQTYAQNGPGSGAELVLETMQVDQPTSTVWLNGRRVGRLARRARPDPTSTWATQRMAAPPDLLQVGRNVLRIEAGLRNPARQYAWWRWENMQLRNIRLVPGVQGEEAAQGARAWPTFTPVSGLPGWIEVNRLRPANGEAGSAVWVTTNHAGGLWRGPMDALDGPDALHNAAHGRTDLVFHDVFGMAAADGVQTHATTDQGVFMEQVYGPDASWHPVPDLPQAYAYVGVEAAGRHWVGFQARGVWRSTRDGGWAPAGLAGRDVLDLLAGPAGRSLYAATDDGVYVLSEIAPDGDAWAPDWERLPDLPASANVATRSSAAARFFDRLDWDREGGLVARNQDRLWRWTPPAQWAPVGPEALQGDIHTAIACCGVGAWLGTNQRNLWRNIDGVWSKLDEAPFGALQLTSGVRRGEDLLMGSMNGLYLGVGAAQDDAARWHVAGGPPATVTDVVVDESTGRIFAATPVGIYTTARPSGASTEWQRTTPPWVVWGLGMDGRGRLFAATSDGLAWSDAPPSGSWQFSQGLESVTFFDVYPHPARAGEVWAGSWGNNIGVSRDRGTTIESLHNGLETLSALDIWRHATPGQITIGTIEGLYRSDDGGQSWFKLPGELQEQTVYAVMQSDNGALWAGAADGLWRSEDYGVTWTRIGMLPPATVVGVGSLPTGNDASVLWAGTEGDGLWFSGDGGNSWSFAGLAAHTVYTVADYTVADYTGADDVAGRWLAATDQGLYLVQPPE